MQFVLEHCCLLTTELLYIKYLRGCLIIAKYIILNRGIRSSFESYRQHFYTFAKLAFDLIRISFVKRQFALKLFLQNKDFYEVCN